MPDSKLTIFSQIFSFGYIPDSQATWLKPPRKRGELQALAPVKSRPQHNSTVKTSIHSVSVTDLH
jgi:hypothetical protein